MKTSSKIALSYIVIMIIVTMIIIYNQTHITKHPLDGINEYKVLYIPINKDSIAVVIKTIDDKPLAEEIVHNDEKSVSEFVNTTMSPYHYEIYRDDNIINIIITDDDGTMYKCWKIQKMSRDVFKSLEYQDTLRFQTFDSINHFIRIKTSGL